MTNPSKVSPFNPLHQGTNFENQKNTELVERNFPQDAFLSEEKRRRSTSAMTVDDHRDSLQEDELETRIDHLLKVREVQNRSIRRSIKNNLKPYKGRNYLFRHSQSTRKNVSHYVRAGSQSFNYCISRVSSWFHSIRRKKNCEGAELKGHLIDQQDNEAEGESD